jgi:hypothetical protein
MAVAFCVCICLAVGQQPEPWEDLLDRQHAHYWANSRKVTPDREGIIELRMSRTPGEVKLERTLIEYKLSYEFSVGEGAVHGWWKELINGILSDDLSFVGGDSTAEAYGVTPDKWRLLEVVQQGKSVIILLDGKPLPGDKVRSQWHYSTQSLTFHGNVRLRNVRLLDLTTNLTNWHKAKDEHILQLNGLPHLKEINLSGSEVTDKGLRRLADFKSLRRIDVRNTKVTAQGVEELKTSLPDCEVLH